MTADYAAKYRGKNSKLWNKMRAPRFGQFLWANFPEGSIPPEFSDPHPVFVLRTAQNMKDICVVIPITSRQPDPIKPYHYEIKQNPNPAKKDIRTWAICNHIYTLNVSRLSITSSKGKILHGLYFTDEDTKGILNAVLKAFPILSSVSGLGSAPLSDQSTRPLYRDAEIS